MKLRRKNLLVEAPALATGDIAFNLVIFFLVCAATQPDSGRHQNMPRSEKEKQEKQNENIEVGMTRTQISLNGVPVTEKQLVAKLTEQLAKATRPEGKVVVVKSSKDTHYAQWIRVTGLIERAGGTVTLQIVEEEETVLPLP